MGTRQTKILFFGDSHAHAIKNAIERRQESGNPVNIEAYRLLKIKNDQPFGDIDLEEFLEKTAALAPEDIVISAIGGNQHAVFSTIQHPQPFNFQLNSNDFLENDPETQIIPARVLRTHFTAGLAGRDGKTLQAFRASTAAHVIHLMPPPPKEDNAHILRHHETRFRQENISQLGVSSPKLRLKFWQLQTSILRSICDELDIQTMLPPDQALTSDGFLKPEYYAGDATHANTRYGELVLQQIEMRSKQIAREPQRLP